MEPFDVDLGDVRRAVAECGLFTSLDADAFDELCRDFTGVRVTTGETLMQEGDNADDLYIVRHGRLRAVVDSVGGELTVGEVGKSEVVGEMAVITDQDRSATVRALRDTDLYRLSAEAFAALVRRRPEMLRPFASVVVERLRTAMQQPAAPALPATIVLVMLADEDAIEFAQRLAAALAPFRSAVVTAADAAGRTDVAGWLLEIETNTDLSILVADSTATEWTQRCLRHADHIEVIVDDSTPITLGGIGADAACRERLGSVPLHLVSLHHDTPRTGHWLRQHEFTSYINVHADHDRDLSRLARFITGRANVLVLGGGGARGFAHLGVVQVLRESGVPVDGIVGTSAGAVVGALLARFRDASDAERMALEWFDEVKWRKDFTPPRVALTTGRTMTEGLMELGGGLDIEQLPIGFAAISCDLVAAEPFIHDRGPVWQAIRSSGSVPGLFPPVQVGERLLVDGGLVANMPTSIARSRHPNATLIAVDVGDPAGIVTGGATSDGIVSGWDRLRRRTTHDTITLPRVLMRLTELGRNDSTADADIAISPDVRGFGITETKQAREIIARGRAAAEAALAELTTA